MRISATTALVVFALAGCGSESGDARGDQPRVERCVDRLLQGARPEDLANTRMEEARRYIRVTYCERFESRGWVYDDGALSIAAQRWLEEGGSEVCKTATAGGPTETVPCEDELRIDCAMLRHVRRSEVREYLAQLRPDVECDDGAPVEQLGVP